MISETEFSNENENILVKIDDLIKFYGKFCSISNLTMSINKGEVIGFLGPNGAGKTTTMKIMANILNPSSGRVWYRKNNKFLQLNSKTKDYLLGNVGFLVESPTFYSNVTPRQLLTYFAKLKGYPREKISERVEIVIKMFKMEEWIDKKIGTFSKGMKEKIGIASAIVHDPEIIILDEPQTGLDPKARVEIRNFILQLKQVGKTIFFSSHLLYEVNEIADRIAIINKGRLVAFDTLKNLEMQINSSIIHLQIRNSTNNTIENLISEMTTILQKMINQGIIKDKISYTSETRTFHIHFDGNEEHQMEILKLLNLNDIQITEYSVPKAGLLENLYLSLVSDSTNPQGVINLSVPESEVQMT